MPEAEGRYVFGYPGGTVINIYDEIFNFRRSATFPRLEQVGPRGRRLARASAGAGSPSPPPSRPDQHGDPHPTAYMIGAAGGDHRPVPTPLIGIDAFWSRHHGITRPCSKPTSWWRVKGWRPSSRAFYIAAAAGPARCVDIPEGRPDRPDEFKYPEHVDLRGYKPTIEGHRSRSNGPWRCFWRRKAAGLRGGRGHLGNASELLTKLCTMLNVPVTTTLKGRGVPIPWTVPMPCA